MQVVRDGDWLTVTRVTGPSHNLLSLKLESGGPALQVPSIEALDRDAGVRRIADKDVLEEVRAAAAAANTEFGTSFRITGIRFLRGDTPPLKVYRLLTERLIAAAAEAAGAAPRLRAAG